MELLISIGIIYFSLQFLVHFCSEYKHMNDTDE